MEITQLIAMLTEGLPADQAAIVTSAIQRDAVKAKASTLKAQSEYEQILADQAALRAQLEGGPDKPGAKAYQEWYERNYAAVDAQNKSIQAYDKKHGDGAFLRAAAGEPVPTAQPVPGGKSYTDDDIQRLVDKRIQEGYAPRWSDLMLSTNDIYETHRTSGRKNRVDMRAISKLADEKYQGNLMLAYDEWDKPEREKYEKESRDTEVDRRVKEELQKRGASSHFPAAADMSPSSMSSRSPEDLNKFSRSALVQDLVKTWNAPDPS